MASPYPSTEAQAELQKLLYDTLTGDANVMALVDGVYDRIPPNPFKEKGGQNAYISFGAADVVNEDAECLIESLHTVQIDCWSRQVGSVHCKRIVDAVYAVLHENSSLELSANALVGTQIILRQVFGDPDGLTTHGVIQLQAQIEERADSSGGPPYVLSSGLWDDSLPWDDTQPWKDGP
jgi:uncharacterized protein DUF3168